MFFSSAAWADRDDWHERHEHYGYHDEYRGGGYGYTPQPPVVQYAPAPQYYAPPPRYYGPTPQGLIGGMVGSAVGYEMGGGNPLATGIGAAAGSIIGAQMGR